MLLLIHVDDINTLNCLIHWYQSYLCKAFYQPIPCIKLYSLPTNPFLAWNYNSPFFAWHKFYQSFPYILPAPSLHDMIYQPLLYSFISPILAYDLLILFCMTYTLVFTSSFLCVPFYDCLTNLSSYSVIYQPLLCITFYKSLSCIFYQPLPSMTFY